LIRKCGIHLSGRTSGDNDLESQALPAIQTQGMAMVRQDPCIPYVPEGNKIFYPLTYWNGRL